MRNQVTSIEAPIITDCQLLYLVERFGLKGYLLIVDRRSALSFSFIAVDVLI